MDYVVVVLPTFVALALIWYSQYEASRKRIRFLEVKVEALMQHTGLKFDKASLVPVEVHQAVKAGHRLKAIRLYRKITGADLEQASAVVDELLKKPAGSKF